jgi:hypothetical protein
MPVIILNSKNNLMLKLILFRHYLSLHAVHKFGKFVPFCQMYVINGISNVKGEGHQSQLSFMLYYCITFKKSIKVM